MTDVPKSWRSRLKDILHHLDISGLTLLTVTVMVLGIFVITRDAMAVSVLLMVPVALLAWVNGVGAGFIIALVAMLLTAPLPAKSSIALLTTPHTTDIWLALSLGYLLLGFLAGVQGSQARRRFLQRYGEISSQLNKTQSYTDRYEEMLETLHDGQERLQRMNDEMEFLSSIATAVNRSLDVSRIQVIAMANIGNLLDVDEVQIFGLEPPHETFVLQAARPMTYEKITNAAPLTLPAHEGLLGRVLATEETQIIGEMSGDLHLRPSTINAEMKSVLAVPMRSHSGLLGVLVLARSSGTTFTQDDRQFLESISRVLTVAIENARLFVQVQELSLSDELTGLANRRMFNVRLAVEMNRAEAAGGPLNLIIFDLDYFKKVNDRYGHLAGDEVLRQFVKKVQTEIRGTDLFCRIGGEEFALLSIDTELAVTIAIAERICRRVASTPITLDAQTELSMTVSAGIAAWCAEINTAEGLIESADQALYAAKANGRNRVEVFHCQTPRTPVA